MPRPLWNRWAWPIVLALLGGPLAGFAAFRLAFFGLYRERFAAAEAGDLLAAFLAGERYDLSIVLTVAGLPALALLAASPWRHRRGVLWAAALWVIAAAIVLFVLEGIDLFYFDFVGRHVSFEVLALASDWRPLAALIAEGYRAEAAAVLAALALAAAGALGGLRRLAARPYAPVPRWSQALQVALLAAFVVAGSRGGFQSKPLAVGWAFQGGDTALGHLALNAAVTVKATLFGRRQHLIHWMPETEALARTRRLLALPPQPPVPRYPLLREPAAPAAAARPVSGRDRSGTPSSDDPAAPRKNLVIIAIESFSAQHTGALGGASGVTDRFDGLAREGLLFSNFYANGTRSVEGIAAIVSGYPAVPGAPVIGSALEQSTLPSLARMLEQEGYGSVFVHGAFRGSMWLDSFAERNGFGRFIAQEDFPDYAAKSDGTWGIFDEYALERLHEEIAAAPKPVFAFLFTLGPHTPFQLPDERFRKFAPGVPNADLLNAFAYTDHALGRFFDLARQSDYWRNTVFLVTADHNMGKGALNRREAMWIPLLILDPGDSGFPRGERRATLGSQADIAPTALELLGLSVPAAFAGRSLLAEGGPRFALHAWAEQAGWQEQGWFVVHDRKRPLALYRPEADPALARNLLRDPAAAAAARETLADLRGYLQTVNNLLLTNRVMPWSGAGGGR